MRERKRHSVERTTCKREAGTLLSRQRVLIGSRKRRTEVQTAQLAGSGDGAHPVGMCVCEREIRKHPL